MISAKWVVLPTPVQESLSNPINFPADEIGARPKCLHRLV